MQFVILQLLFLTNRKIFVHDLEVDEFVLSSAEQVVHICEHSLKFELHKSCEMKGVDRVCPLKHLQNGRKRRGSCATLAIAGYFYIVM